MCVAWVSPIRAGAAEKKLAKAKTNHDVSGLLDKQTALIADINQKEDRLSQLGEEIVNKQHTVADLSELEVKRIDVSATLAEFEAKRKSEVTQREAFESFLGIISSLLSAKAIQKFLDGDPQLIAFAKAKQYSPQLLRNFIIKQLSAGTLEILRCSSCKARFYVDTPPRSLHLGHHCQLCGSAINAFSTYAVE